ncbi:MAG: lipopolysaccharide transport periplasmic protein LptA [Zoogloeaceae bacterium]|jgi:lipopolysaccharide export system protein LptA|nr:lipopolysaccharide transport periplasmic protein LptA [Zoogloeaceae bacterium]
MSRFLFFPLVFLLLASSAYAEKADREKPIALEAERIAIDDLKRVQTLEGNVVLTQGTLTIRSDKIVVTEDAAGFRHGVAFAGPGGLARFRQKREGREEWMEGEAERIEYDTRTEVAEFFHRAWVKSGADQLRGDYIWYDAIAERYLATAGEGNAADAAPPRVRVVIQPRNQSAPEGEPDAGSVPPEVLQLEDVLRPDAREAP